MKPPKKAITKTKPKIKAKPTTKTVAKQVANKNAKEKPAFSLKGIPAPFKWICTIVLANAASQTECDELILVGINAFENLHETESPEIAVKTQLQVVTQAILTKKATYINHE